jgi:ABC-2 type transport system ATP-binding protein
LPGELRLYENMSGRQLINFLSRLRDQSVDGELERLARRFDIDLDRPIADLSSGMKRKVALLQVLVPKVPLLILDEPTNTLDPTMRDELLGQLRQVRDEGRAVLFSSHVLSEVEQVCDRVGILQRGRLVHVQAMKDLRQGRLIKARFLRIDSGRPTSADEPPVPIPSLAGLRLRQCHLDEMTLEYVGPLPPLLAWLAQQPLLDLKMEPLGLSTIYAHYHGVEA